MTIFIVVTDKDNSPSAVAAFSSEDKMKVYIEDEAIESPRFDFFEVSEEEAHHRKIFASHAVDLADVDEASKDEKADTVCYQLAGYFFTKFEAIKAAGENGYVNEFNIDLVEDEPDVVKAKKEKPKADGDEFRDFVQSQKARQEEYKKISNEQMNSALKHTRQYYILIMLVLVFGGILAYLFMNRSGAEFAENVETVDWLPSPCHNISYFKSENIVVYEFESSYAGVTLWAKREGLELEKLKKGESVKVKTYRRYAPIDTESLPELQGLSEEEKWTKWEMMANPQIEVGVKVVADRDSPEWIVEGAYDVNRGKTYFWSKRKP